MQRRPDIAGKDEEQILRFAWGIAFIATIAVAAILGLVSSAQGLTLPASSPIVPAATPAPDEEDTEEAGVSEDEEFEVEECEEDEECEEEEQEKSREAPDECLLRSAEATVFAATSQDRVRLQIRYTATSPTPVAFDYGLHGGKGGLYLGSEKKRLGRQGTLRLNKDLTETQMTKVMAAKNFTVRLRVPAAPRYCQAFFDRQLDVRRATPSGLSWQQSQSE